MDILIVDDEKSIRLTTSIALEADGHYVETAEDGPLALRRIKEENFELVFLDLRLGDEDGLDVLQKIVALKPQQLVTIFTAHASIATAVKATQLGAFDYLEKPFTPDQLRAIVVKAQKALKTQGEVSSSRRPSRSSKARSATPRRRCAFPPRTRKPALSSTSCSAPPPRPPRS